METTNNHHHPCAICGIICLNINILFAHITTMHPDLSCYKCHICNKEIKDYCVLKRLETHFVMFHLNKKIKIAKIKHEFAVEKSDETFKTTIGEVEDYNEVHYFDTASKNPSDVEQVAIFHMSTNSMESPRNPQDNHGEAELEFEVEIPDNSGENVTRHDKKTTHNAREVKNCSIQMSSNVNIENFELPKHPVDISKIGFKKTGITVQLSEKQKHSIIEHIESTTVIPSELVKKSCKIVYELHKSSIADHEEHLEFDDIRSPQDGTEFENKDTNMGETEMKDENMEENSEMKCIESPSKDPLELPEWVDGLEFVIEESKSSSEIINNHDETNDPSSNNTGDPQDETELEIKQENMEETVNKHVENRKKICIFCFSNSEKTLFQHKILSNMIQHSLNLEDIRIPVGLCKNCSKNPDGYIDIDGSLRFACHEKFDEPNFDFIQAEISQNTECLCEICSIVADYYEQKHSEMDNIGSPLDGTESENKDTNMDETEMIDENMEETVNKHEGNRKKVCLFCFSRAERSVLQLRTLPSLIKQLSLNLDDKRIPVGICSSCRKRPERYKQPDGSLILACFQKFDQPDFNFIEVENDQDTECQCEICLKSSEEPPKKKPRKLVKNPWRRPAKPPPTLVCIKCFQEYKHGGHKDCGESKRFENLCNMLDKSPKMAQSVVNHLLDNFETCPVTGAVELSHFNGGRKTKIYKTLPKDVDLSNKNYIEMSMNNVIKYFESQGLSTKAGVLREVYENSSLFSEKIKSAINEFGDNFKENDSTEAKNDIENDSNEVKEFFHCDTCNKTFKSFFKCKNHQKNCKEQRPSKIPKITCEFCNANVGKTYESYSNHLENYHSKNICPVCNKGHETLEDLQNHIENDHEKNACPMCGQEHDTFEDLKIHKRIDHPTKSFICESCGKIFSSIHTLLVHSNSAHEVSLQCKHCEKVFEFKHQLKSHIKKVHDKLPCNLCGEMFTEPYMKRHVISKHTADHLKPHICQVCKKGFLDQKNLDIHMNIHTGDKPFLCKYCGKGFTDPRNMSMHERMVHQGYKRPKK